MSAPRNPTYLCQACGVSATGLEPEAEMERRCPVCSGHLVVNTPKFASWSDATSDRPWISRYESLLPVKPMLLPDGEDASLEMIQAPMLAERLGVRECVLIPLSRNRTGTFKDLEAGVLSAKVSEWGLSRVSVHSTGNTARSYRFYLGAAGVSVAVFIPSDCLAKLSGLEATRDQPIFAFDGPFPLLSRVAKTNAVEMGRVHLAPLHWKVEGKSVVAYALAEKFPEVDLIVQTIAGGYGPIGMELGFSRAAGAGLPVPRRYGYGLFQADDADTLALALNEDRETLSASELRLPPDPYEVTLQSTNPLATFDRVRSLMKTTATSSFIASVPRARVEEERTFLTEACSELNVPLSFEREKSPFISWAGLMQRAEEPGLDTNSRLAILVTGSSPYAKGSNPTLTATLKPLPDSA